MKVELTDIIRAVVEEIDVGADPHELLDSARHDDGRAMTRIDVILNALDRIEVGEVEIETVDDPGRRFVIRVDDPRIELASEVFSIRDDVCQAENVVDLARLLARLVDRPGDIAHIERLIAASRRR